MEVDKTFLAGRIALRPLEYAGKGRVNGHYAVAQTSGAIAATPTALDVHASIRWAASTAYLVLMRIKCGWGVISAVTTAVRMAYQASIVRNFTVDYVTGSTAINMATIAKTGAMRSSMGQSLLGTAGPRITTTGAMTGQTGILDAAPFASTNWPGILSSNATGTAVLMGLGFSGNMQTLYECTGNGQHPVVLAENEGVAVQLVHTGWATGTLGFNCVWEWAEVEVF